MATLANFRSRVRELTGIRSPGVLTDTEIDAFVNEASFAVLASRDWPFLIETANVVVDTGDSSATFTSLSATAHRVVDVYAQTGNSRAFQLFERAESLIPEPFTARPSEFYWNPGTATMDLYPNVSGEWVLTGRFVIEPSALVVDSDVSPIPERFAACVPFLAAARILEREGDQSERAERFEARAWELVGDMVRVLLTSSRRTAVLGGRGAGRRGVRRQGW